MYTYELSLNRLFPRLPSLSSCDQVGSTVIPFFHFRFGDIYSLHYCTSVYQQVTSVFHTKTLQKIFSSLLTHNRPSRSPPPHYPLPLQIYTKPLPDNDRDQRLLRNKPRKNPTPPPPFPFIDEDSPVTLSPAPLDATDVTVDAPPLVFAPNTLLAELWNEDITER